jgi:multiple antibiotic resistance protein
VNTFVSIWIKFFFLLTPFFVLSMFLALTQGMDEKQRRKVAVRVTWAIVVISVSLFLFGNALFRVFGITVDAFRVGAGVLLFLSAVDLVRSDSSSRTVTTDGDIAVVPLAVPITIGPATTGALLVMGSDASAGTLAQGAVSCAGLLAALLCVSGLLFAAASVERLIGKQGLTILSKLTGLVLAALAAQIVFAGLHGLMGTVQM